jgi:pimeloyl-ACP methyl ester carboxylesterase
MVAVEWAARHPAELAGAVLINTSLSGISPLHHRLRLGIWPLLARIAMTADTQERERLIFQMTSALDPSAAQIDGRVDIHRRHPVRLGNVVRQLCAAACYHPPLTRPTVPLLLLNSLGDRMVDPACSEALARHWDAPLRSHPWAGHDLPLDDPDWTATTVCAWLDGLASLEP